MRQTSIIILIFISIASLSVAQNTPAFRNTSLSVDARVNDLLKQLTLEEKICLARL